MEYELDIEGYVLNVYFGCNNDDTTPYAGDMPEGYSTLEDWAENEEIKAWKIVDGNLVKDNAKEAELMDQFENEHNDNKNVSHKELVPLEDAINILNASQPYKTANKTGKFISLNDAKASQPDFRLTNIDPYAFDKINLMVTGKNILPNTATSKEIDGLTITQNSDRSITLDGTAIPEGETVEGTYLTINDAEQNKKAKIKRIKGATIQDGEPSPDNEVPILNVSGDNDVIVVNDNFYDGNEVNTNATYNSALCTDSNSFWYSRVKIDSLPTLPLTFSTYINVTNNNYSNCRIRLAFYDSNNNFIQNKGGTGATSSDKRSYLVLTENDIPENADYLYIMVRIQDGGYTEKTQISYGTSLTDYVPYQQQTFRFDLGGKNLLNPSNVTTSNGITSTLNNDGSISSNGTPNNRDYNLTNYMDFNLPAGTYTFSIDHAREYEIVLCLRNANNEEEIHSIGSGDKSVVFTTSETKTGWYVWSRASSGTSINETIKIQLEKGSTPSRYSPYVANPIELCKIGDYQDYIYKSGDNWYVHKEITKRTINVTASAFSTARINGVADTKYVTNSIPGARNQGGQHSSNFYSSRNSYIGNKTTFEGYPMYVISSTSVIVTTPDDTIENLKSKVNGAVIYYQLATSQEIEITDNYLIEQLEALQDIQLYEDLAYVTTNSNPKAPMVLEYNLPYNIEYDLAGTINNVVPFLVFKKALDYFLSGLSNFNIKMYNYDGTDRTQIFSGSNGLINMSSDLVATHIVLEIPTETTYDELTLYPQLERGTEATAYETPKIKSAVIDFSNYIDRDTLTTSIDYILTDGAYVTASIDNELVDLDNIYIALFDGYNNVFAIQDVNIEMSYFINALDDGNVFATKLELNAAEGRFELSISEVQDEMDDKLDSADYTRASIVGKINDGTSQVQIEADNISLAGKTIDLSSDNITIDSDNFSVDDEGNMECANANITGGEINLTGGNTTPKITVTNPNDSDIQMKLSSAMLVGSNSDGIELLKLFGNIGAIALYDTTGDNTINMNGLTGGITCKKLTQTSIETGSATMNSTYVDAAENNHYEKAGNVVSYSFTITTKGTWNTTTVFASNLPAPKANTRFVATNVNRNIPFRAEIRTDGTIRNAYSNTTPATGDVLEGHITYITDDN